MRSVSLPLDIPEGVALEDVELFGGIKVSSSSGVSCANSVHLHHMSRGDTIQCISYWETPVPQGPRTINQGLSKCTPWELE